MGEVEVKIQSTRKNAVTLIQWVEVHLSVEEIAL